MNNLKHTPGPWTAIYRPSMSLAGVHVKDCRGLTLEISYCNSSESTRPELDARLLACSPELLETVERMTKLLEHIQRETGYVTLVTQQEAYKLISRATGGAE